MHILTFISCPFQGDQLESHSIDTVAHSITQWASCAGKNIFKGGIFLIRNY
jgi:hypothetical protein